MASRGHCGVQGTGGIVPSRATVVPRVRLPQQVAAVPIDQRVRALLDENPGRCLFTIRGPSGSGKRTALAHLAACLGSEWEVRILDSFDGTALFVDVRPAPGVAASTVPSHTCPRWTLQLVAWGEDEFAEHLLATHPGRCRSVMTRLLPERDGAMLSGLPLLCRIVLDEMAADDSVADVEAALWRFLDRELATPVAREAAEQTALGLIDRAGRITQSPPNDVLGEPLRNLIRHPRIASMIAARRLAEGVPDGSSRGFLNQRLPHELVRRIAGHVRPSPEAIRALRGMAEDRRALGIHAMAASILHATGIGWTPGSDPMPILTEAWLGGACWDGLRLRGCHLERADLREASLANADLAKAGLASAKLVGATLRNAVLRGAMLEHAQCSGANLAAVSADAADFENANLKGAILAGASLRRCDFRDADLTAAILARADLSEADFTGAMLESADLSAANLTGAQLSRLPLARCTLGENVLRRADLSACDLEGAAARRMDFMSATLTGALLTGSSLPYASFRMADLRDCGLAEVDWEGADLNGADLRGATFHMGSTRSGLVGSPIASEGSRTGFYTDEFYETDFKPPEEIRKANLCGADLRFANIEGVDFYLVDLRRARYTTDQAEQLRRCKAIL